MKRLYPFCLIVLAALILGACAGSAQRQPELAAESPVQQGYTTDNFAAPAPTSFPAAQEAPSAGTGGGGDAAPASSTERIVIQNADLTVVVADVETRMNQIEDMAKKMGGYVVTSNLYQSYTSDYTPVPEATLTIRVPADRLDEALESIKKDAVEVQNETRSGQDVTAEYVDLKSRLKNYEAAEAQLNEILKNAQNTEDVVNIFNQLVYYREQIEVTKGQIQYYEEAAALSAVSVRLIAEETIKPVQIGKWEPKGVALTAIQDLIDFWKGFVDFMIRFILYILPVLITIGIPFYLAFLLLRFLFRKMRGNKKKVEPKVETGIEKK